MNDNPAALRHQLTLLADASLAQLDALREVDKVIRDLATRPAGTQVCALTLAARLSVALTGVNLIPMRGDE